MPLSSKSLAGPGYVILNVLRIMNIISFLMAIIASIVMLVRTVIESQFFFFDAVSHVITACFGIFLIFSELSFFRSYFARVWPALSPAHGFVALGIGMLVLGVEILGNLNKPATTQDALGMPIWRIVISSGIVVFTLGFLNIISSYVFRDRKANITARHVRAKGAVAIAEAEQRIQLDYAIGRKVSSGSDASIISTLHDHRAEPIPEPQAERLRATVRNTWSFLRLPFRGDETNHNITKGNDGSKSKLPSYQNSPSSRYSEIPGVRELKISAPLAVNPQFAHLVRPDSAYHPSRGGVRT